VRPLELEGAIGTEQLKKLNSIVSGRRANALKFLSVMEKFPEIQVQKELGRSSWFGFSLVLTGQQLGRRSDLVMALKAQSIAVRPIVAGNFTKNPVLKHLPHVEIADLKNADQVHYEGLFIGNHHYEMNHEFELLENALTSFMK
jgi:CDP-6-deoxy-D-xylo-4-hexulose-3-dehydrase